MVPRFERPKRRESDCQASDPCCQRGNLGDIASVGGGVSEMRIFVGQGYRIYFTMRRGVVILLLCGGDKSSQTRDIKKAKEIMKSIDEV